MSFSWCEGTQLLGTLAYNIWVTDLYIVYMVKMEYVSKIPSSRMEGWFQKIYIYSRPLSTIFCEELNQSVMNFIQIKELGPAM